MKNFMLKHRLVVALLLSCLFAVLVVGGVLAVTYALNKTVPAMVTITATTPPPPPPPVEATLYTDALATVPLPSDYNHSFGTVAQGGTPQSPLWFRAAEIDPTTINVVFTGLPTGAIGGFIVGTPMNSQPGKPCTLALYLSNVPLGTYSFSFVVTGTTAAP